MADTELIDADLMREHGFIDGTEENIRKRSAKKELFESVVSGRFGG